MLFAIALFEKLLVDANGHCGLRIERLAYCIQIARCHEHRYEQVVATHTAAPVADGVWRWHILDHRNKLAFVSKTKKALFIISMICKTKTLFTFGVVFSYIVIPKIQRQVSAENCELEYIHEARVASLVRRNVEGLLAYGFSHVL